MMKPNSLRQRSGGGILYPISIKKRPVSRFRGGGDYLVRRERGRATNGKKRRKMLTLFVDTSGFLEDLRKKKTPLRTLILKGFLCVRPAGFEPVTFRVGVVAQTFWGVSQVVVKYGFFRVFLLCLFVSCQQFSQVC